MDKNAQPINDFLLEWNMQFNNEEKVFQTTFEPTKAAKDNNAFVTDKQINISKFGSTESNYFLLLNNKNKEVV